MELKTYQQTTLDILQEFLSAIEVSGASTAFEKFQRAAGYPSNYEPLPQLENVPYVCLRLPTGGGKTLIGTHAVRIAAENFLACENPFVLWLVPTKEIRQQTLKVLRDPKSSYGKILRGAFNGRVKIFDVADFRNLRVDDLSGLNVCVATFQSFKVTDREGRKVFQANEDMTPLFRKIPRQDYFYIDDKGKHESFANLISFLRPLMIVDEAHNYSTALSFDVTRQLRPAAVIELTATPATNSNVLVKVSAETLWQADMIKFPLILGEVSNSPEKTLDLATQKRAALEKLAVTEDNYIRPIALYQAENRNRDYNVDYVRNYLVNEAKIPEREIAVATGERHELDGVNLLSHDCPIRHIITVQALKEGWDCPFASVFCSMTSTHSPKDAEQLLGRVLRMPYARRRKISELNQSYAFVRVDSWATAIGQIKDDLRGMGFDEHEVTRMVKRQPQLFHATIEVVTSEPPNVDDLSYELQAKISVEQTAAGYAVTFGELDNHEVRELEDNRTKIFRSPEDRNKLSEKIRQYRSAPTQKLSPAQRGVKFSIPQLCLDFGNGATPIQSTTFYPEDWSLVGTGDYELSLSREDPDVKFTEFNLRGDKLINRFMDAEQNLFSGATNWSQAELIGWLADKINFIAVTRNDLTEFTRRVLNQLIHGKNFSLEELVRMRFKIRQRLTKKISACLDDAQKLGWQTTLFNGKTCVDKNIALTFDNENYPAQIFYTGSTQFNKHFYPQVGDMNDEEILCARFIDENPHVETWIRNVERNDNSFWLPTHTDRFYPDFVIKLTDGTFAAVEYKGAHLADSSDTREKNLIGNLWAHDSGGLCKFIMAVMCDERSRDLSTQLNDFFGG